PGVYDTHAPGVPRTAVWGASGRVAVGPVRAPRLWVNPDCGLKTRKPDEVNASLANLVAAAKEARASL
ncbi:hypothetical protein, partial [Mycolicibacter arupensis]|uniref:hypothetical protein n=1 Tax=Mycolicibacter arupensis TaxID=342002 RepID=UPI003B3B0DDC